MDLIFQGAVNGEICLRRFVKVTSTNPARMFGLYPKKGIISPDSDADLVLYNPPEEQVLSASTYHMAVDYSCYEGMRVTGRLDSVLSRGRQIIESGACTGVPGHGRLLRRSLSDNLR